MSGLPACVCVSIHTCLMPVEASRDNQIPGTGVLDCREPSCRCWESNLSPLEEQSVLFTSELSLQFPCLNIVGTVKECFFFFFSYVECILHYELAMNLLVGGG